MKKPKIVAVDTSLGTNFLVSACKDATMSELRGLIQREHRSCFPEHGRISIKALTVEYDNREYHVTESILVGQLLRRSWNKIHAEVSANGRDDSRGLQPMRAGSLADEKKGSLTIPVEAGGRADSHGSQLMQAGSLAIDKNGSLAAIVDRSLLTSHEPQQNPYCKDISAERRSSEVALALDDEDEACDYMKDNTGSQNQVGYPFFSFETPQTQPCSELNAATLAVLNRDFKREGKKRRGSHVEDQGAVSKKQREEGEQCSDEANKLIPMSAVAEEKKEDLGMRVTLHEAYSGPPNVQEEQKNGDKELKKDTLQDDLTGLEGLTRLDKQAIVRGDSVLTHKERVALLGLGKMKLPPKAADSFQAASKRAVDEVGSMGRSQKTTPQNCYPSESSESTKNEEEGIVKNKSGQNYHMEDETKGYPIQLNENCILLVASVSADVVPETQESDMETQVGMAPGREQNEIYEGEAYEKMIVEDAMNREAEKVMQTLAIEAGRKEPFKCMSVEVEEPQLKSGSPRDSDKGVEGSPPLYIDLSQHGELADAAAGAEKDNSIYRRKKKRRRRDKVFKVHDVVDHGVDSQEDQGSKEVHKDNSREINNHEPLDVDKVMEGPDEPKHRIPSSSQDTSLRPDDDESSQRETQRSGLSPEDDEASRKEMQRSMLSLEDEQVSRRACNDEDAAEKFKDLAMKKRKKRKKKGIHAVCEQNVETRTNSGFQKYENGWANDHADEGSRCTICREPPYAVTEVKEGLENYVPYVVARKLLKGKKVVAAIENIKAQDQDLASLHKVDGTSSPVMNVDFVIEGSDEPKHHIPKDIRIRSEYDEASEKETARSELLPEDDEASRREMQRSKLSTEDDESSRREMQRSKPSDGATCVDLENCNYESVTFSKKKVSHAMVVTREGSPEGTTATGRPCIAGQAKVAAGNEESGEGKQKDVAMKRRKKRKKESIQVVSEEEPVQAVCDQNLEVRTNSRPLNSESGGADEHINEGSICVVNTEPPNAVTEVREGPESRGVYSGVEQVDQKRLRQKKVVVSMEKTEAQGTDIASVLKVDGTSCPGFVVTSSANEAVEVTNVKAFEVFEYDSSQTGEKRQAGESCQLEAKSTQMEAHDLDQLCSAAVKIVEEDMHSPPSTVACRRTARKSVHPKRWITVLSERLTWSQSSKSKSKRKSSTSKPTREGLTLVGVQAAIDPTSEVSCIGEEANIEAGKITCPVGCGRVYTGKTSAFYRHRRKCAG